MYLAGEKEIFFAVERLGGARVVAPEAGKKKKGGKRTKGAKGKEVLWSVPGDLQVRGMILAGEGEEKRLYVVGAKGDWRTSLDAWQGKEGCVLRVVSIGDGKVLSEQAIPGLPVFDGISAASGRLYLSLTDGRIVCLEKP
jgi:hypothetical protein